MPYSYDPNLEDEKKKAADGEAGATDEQVVSGTPGTTAATATSAPQSSSTGKTQSGQYTNLQSYLDANQDSGFGDKVVGKVQGDLDKADQAREGLANDFRGQVQGNTLSYDQGLVDRTKADASSVRDNANDSKKFSAMREGEYGGPSVATDASSYQAASDAMRRGQTVGNLTQGEGNQRTLIGDYFGKPSYSAGQKNLDQFLLQGDAGAQSKLADQRTRASGLENSLTSLSDQLGTEGAAAKKNNSDVGLKMLEEFLGPQGFLGQTQNTLKGTTSRGTAAVAAREAALKADPSSLVSGPRYGLDPSGYIQSDANNIDYRQTVNGEEANDYQALLDLLGDQSQASFLDPTQAGKFDANSRVGLKNNFSSDLGGRKQAYQQVAGGNVPMTEIMSNPANPNAQNPYVKQAATKAVQLMNSAGLSSGYSQSSVPELTRMAASDPKAAQALKIIQQAFGAI